LFSHTLGYFQERFETPLVFQIADEDVVIVRFAPLVKVLANRPKADLAARRFHLDIRLPISLLVDSAKSPR